MPPVDVLARITTPKDNPMPRPENTVHSAGSVVSATSPQQPLPALQRQRVDEGA